MKFNKGMDSLYVAIVFIFITLILEGFVASTLFVNSNVVRRISKETEVIEAVNSMEFLKKSLRASVEYSVYKSSYDVLSHGGYLTIPSEIDSKGCIPYISVYSDKSDLISEDELIGNVENTTMEIFDCYAQQYSSEYSQFGINIYTPNYSGCGKLEFSEIGDDYVTVVMDSRKCDTDFIVSNGFVTISEPVTSFEEIINVNFLDILRKSSSVFDDRFVLSSINSATSSFGCDSMSVREDECSYIGDSEDDIGRSLLESKCGNWESRLRSSIESKLNKIDIDGLDMSFHVDRIETDYSVECDVCEEVVKEVEECTEERIEFDSCPGVCVDSPHICSSQYPGRSCTASSYECGTCCCTEPDSLTEEVCVTKEIVEYETTCRYSYSADVDVIISITDKNSVKYPIGDSWRKMELKFRILDGNLGDMDISTDECGEFSYC